VAVGVLALVVVGVAWTLASPIAASPDDDFHLASIWCAGGDPNVCRRTGETREGIETVLVSPAIGQGMGCYHPLPDTSAACQTEVLTQSGLAPSRANDGLYPGGFYRGMSLLASSNVERSVLVMRMISWLLAMSLLVAAAVLAGPDLRRAFAIAALTSFVPMGVFLFASNNPSGLMVAAVVAYWCGAYAYMSDASAPRRRTVAAVTVLILSSLVALASRSDAGVYLGVASLVVWISTGGYLSGLRRRSLILLGVSVVGAVGVLTGAQSQQAIQGSETPYEAPLTILLFDNARELPRLVLGSLGLYPLGSLDTPMPAVVSTLMVLAFGGAVVGGLSVATKEKWIASSVVAGALVVLPMTVLVTSDLLVGSQGYVQPRYVLPLLPMLVGTAVMAPRGRTGIGLHFGQVMILAGAVVVAHAAALHTTIRRYVTGLDERGPDLRENVEWWWETGPGPLTTWLLGATAFAVAVACGLTVVGWRPSDRGVGAGS
jgi:hypothetical protein